MALASSFHRRCLGIVLLALWLGWTSVGLGRSTQASAADLAAARTLLDELRQQAPHAGPMAFRLSPPCGCAGTDESRWQALATTLASAGGQARRVTTTTRAPRWELLIADAHGQLAYAGPLRAPALLCGNADDPSWTRALPALLQAGAPALVVAAPPACDCRLPS